MNKPFHLPLRPEKQKPMTKPLARHEGVHVAAFSVRAFENGVNLVTVHEGADADGDYAETRAYKVDKESGTAALVEADLCVAVAGGVANWMLDEAFDSFSLQQRLASAHSALKIVNLPGIELCPEDLQDLERLAPTEHELKAASRFAALLALYAGEQLGEAIYDVSVAGGAIVLQAIPLCLALNKFAVEFHPVAATGNDDLWRSEEFLKSLIDRVQNFEPAFAVTPEMFVTNGSAS